MVIVTSLPWIFQFFDMISLHNAVYSGFVFPLYHSWLSLHNWGMLWILVNIFQLFINIVQCYIVVKWQAFITSPSKAIFELFSREMLLLHSHLNHQCHRITCCFEGFILIYVSIQAHYVVWSSSEAPQPLFSAKSIFFSGLMAGPTYRPPVWSRHPLGKNWIRRMERVTRDIRYRDHHVLWMLKFHLISKPMHDLPKSSPTVLRHLKTWSYLIQFSYR